VVSTGCKHFNRVRAEYLNGNESIPVALRRRRDYAGPALFSYGFRPFFLGGASWAALAILLWLPQYFGELTVPTAFGPLDWPSTK